MGTTSQRLAFGPFTLDPRSLELERDGVRVPLPPQPAGVLALLLSHPGELVTREEIRDYVWGDQAIEFEAGLHSCIRQIRRALNDEANAPMYVETVPRRGYRFIGSLDETVVAETPARPATGRRAVVAVAALVVVIVAFAVTRMGDTERAPAPPETVRLVVMPFEDRLAPQANDVAFVAALDEEIRTELSRLDPERLGVIARASSKLLRDRDASVPEIGVRLDATHMLEGAVRQVAEGVSITAQLIRVEDEVQVWADRFVRTNVDGDLALDIAQQVTDRLAPELLPALRRPEARPAVPDEARRAVLEADLLLRESRAEPAALRLRQAVDLAPDYANAFALLAKAHLGESRWDEAEAAARRALSLNDQLAEAARVLGDVELYGRLRVDAAGPWYRRAVELAPTDPAGLMSLAWWWVARGETERGIEGMRSALRWDPISPLVYGDAPWFYFYGGRLDDAVAESGRNLDLLPDLASAIQCRIAVALVRGDVDEAWRWIGKARSSAGLPPIDPEAVGIESLDGFVRRNLAAIEADQTSQVRNSRMARMHAVLGEKELALDNLGRALERRETDLLFVAVDPHYDTLRGDPRFEEILRAIARLSHATVAERGA